MKTFKVGDKVRVIAKHREYYKCLGIVTHVNMFTHHPFIEVKHDPKYKYMNNQRSYYLNQIVKVNSEIVKERLSIK